MCFGYLKDLNYAKAVGAFYWWTPKAYTVESFKGNICRGSFEVYSIFDIGLYLTIVYIVCVAL